MSRDRLASDYSENISDVTTCSCITSSIEKCSVRGCDGMFQEPFFLHPPGSRPRNGLYINPMNSPFQVNRQKDSASSNGSESFYLHSPHDLVYTRITHLFEDSGSSIERNISSSRSSNERKDETLTVKVDVHINNGMLKSMGSGSPSSLRSELGKDSGSEHAYEQICIGQEDQTPSSSKYPGVSKKLSDNASDGSRSRKLDRRYSRGSSTSESSNLSSEVHCYSSTGSTPSLSRNSSHERTTRSPKIAETLTERKNSTTSSTKTESEKETKTAIVGPSIFRPPPPPPPPPEIEEVVVVTPKIEHNIKDEKNDGNHLSTKDQKNESNVTTILAVAGKCTDEDDTDAALVTGTRTTRQGVGSSVHPPVGNGTSSATAEEEPTRGAPTSSQVPSHLLSRHMVLPFIPPKFANQASDSESLLKPSEYLRSICKAASPGTTNSLSKARSVDNLDIHTRSSEEEPGTVESNAERVPSESSGPPPPPLPPLPPPPLNGLTSPSFTTPLSPSSNTDTEPMVKHSQQLQSQQPQQPLATISIQDLTSVQLRRTNLKMHSTKTFSAPPNRSVSMTNVSEAFFVQKTDLIAELKKTKDIPGIKKLKVQRAQVEKSQEQNLITEINKAFSISNFVDQIPEKDNAGNVIPIWKRQMLARKAAERARKELEEQIARENEEKRQKAIPPWKRQLLAKKDSEVKNVVSNPVQTSLSITVSSSKIEAPIAPKKDTSLDINITASPTNVFLVSTGPSKSIEENKSIVIEQEEKRIEENNDTESVHIIPWRAQLRKTNSKLNILE